jgi:hypothetical protein
MLFGLTTQFRAGSPQCLAQTIDHLLQNLARNDNYNEILAAKDASTREVCYIKPAKLLYYFIAARYKA